MIPRTSRDAQGWLATVQEGLDCLGCAIVEGVADEALLAAARDGLRQAQRGVEEEVGRARLERAGELGVVRLPMRFAPVFFRFLELPEVLAVIDRTVSDTAILHLQNGLVLPPLTGATPADLFQLNFHMDFRRVLNGYLCSINTLFAIDAFTADNGATVLVPGTHQKPKAPEGSFLRDHAVAVECPAGSMLVFDSTLWHAAGRNLSGRDRLGLNQQFTRSYFKQQIDYVRGLGDDVVLAQAPRTQQLLGWYTRVVTSLDAFTSQPTNGSIEPARGEAAVNAGSDREAATAAAPGELLGEVAAYYAARYRAFGDSARGMDWKDEASQRLRFEVLTRCLDLRGTPTLLDVGCGNGELLAFLEERSIGVRYLGIDVCPEMVAACQRRFGPDSAALASTADLAARGWAADYVVASGTFNVKQATAEPVWHGYVERAVRQMYDACRLATVFNIMTARVDRRYDHLYYLDPARAPAFAELCGTRRFVLDHSYPLFELTMALMR